VSDDFDDDDYDEPEPELDELRELAADAATESTERLHACIEVWRQEPDAGRDLLIAYTISLDADHEDRVIAVERLLDLGEPVNAAVLWLISEVEFSHLDGVYRYREEGIIPVLSARDDLAAGLSLIVANRYLDDTHRIWAGAYRVIDWTKDSFAELRTHFSDATIVSGLEDVAKRDAQTSSGTLIADTALSWIVDDKTLPAGMRFRAAGARYMIEENDGADAFEALASDPSLSTGQRRKAIEELAEIDSERADKFRRDHPQDQIG
jgi:hypothetical protein